MAQQQTQDAEKDWPGNVGNVGKVGKVGNVGNIGLVADIGGTNARFAAIDHATGERLAQARLATPTHGDGTRLLVDACAALSVEPCACVLALAGPIVGSRVALTNADLTFDQAALQQQLGCRVELINDFVAMSRAIPAVRSVSETEVSLVIGPGTGLGVGFLVPTTDGLKVCSSEAGNAGFAPSDELEQELLAVLRPEFPVLSWESLISGPGLVTLYKGLCTLWGADPVLRQPEDISERGLAMSDPLCHQSLEVFFSILGSVAGHLALTLGARGGVFLVGDMLGKLRAFVDQSQFRPRFEAQGAQGTPAAALLAQIPTQLVLETDLGLTGVVHYARDAWS